MPTVYFRSEKGYAHELSDETPAQKAGSAMTKLSAFQTGDDVEVFINGAWVAGTIRTAQNLRFVVDCVTFNTESEVLSALANVLSPLHAARDSMIPWVKIVPPSKQG